MPRDLRFFICERADAEHTVPGSSYDRTCSLCGSRVMVAPSGVEYLRRFPEIAVACAPCVLPNVLAEQIERGEINCELAADLETLVREAAARIANPYRRRN